MAKKKPTRYFEVWETASEHENRRNDQDETWHMEGTSLLQGSTDALQILDKYRAEPRYGHVYHDVADDADDELETAYDKDSERIQLLNIQESKTGRDSDLGM